ncbi:1-hydroxycarotenoid 3,4-desaturase CrtD [uncultured Roseovarius sp.]|uniref:1-hydroxycarotenoid 3,4-desaturase CrtD n=1 Tax=uncultured Roseovarius sp. TaxID=293344 RepID=UPI002620FEDA|nr:1-hydroxycarotenoid 3,4-desaturase CrtD [uncultured Roseovarius sp.]
MNAVRQPSNLSNRAIVIGAGIAGLATAARLVHAGMHVTVHEAHATPGGKMRCLPSSAGPVDAGPTVLTMRPVVEQLYSDLGETLNDHLTLIRQRVIARHFWADGSQLDLFDDEDENIAAIERFSDASAARQFRDFCTRARQLFQAFDAPMMQAPTPSLAKLARYVGARPGLLTKLAPFSTLHSLLCQHFDDPRLIQLFGRYATYVGGSPYQAPALLALIWQAEAAGVWAVQGGMHQLAQSLVTMAKARGVEYRFGMPVERIEIRNGMTAGVTLADGSISASSTVIFNGDPRALSQGLLGNECASLAPQTTSSARSLSAEVWAFAARVAGPELAHHNVFFRKDPKPEFDMLARGEMIPDPTIYLCAMDRGMPSPSPDTERFETIANAPSMTTRPTQKDFSRCQKRTFQTLAKFGLRFDPMPGQGSLTTPSGFDKLFPASAGALYGQSPHGLTASIRRPQARTAIKGLYLTGGCTHPGAGVPMALLSARHAVEAILNDRTLTSMSRQTVTPGGMSTASATTGVNQSASSGS